MVILAVIVGAILSLIACLSVPFMIGAGLVKLFQRGTGFAIQADLDQRSRLVDFQVSKSFLPEVGLAFDTKRQLFYVGLKEGGRVRGGIYPFSALLKYDSGHDFLGNNQKFYLDITVDDLNAPRWRFWFGGAQRKLSDVTSTIDVVWERSASGFTSS